MKEGCPHGEDGPVVHVEPRHAVVRPVHADAAAALRRTTSKMRQADRRAVKGVVHSLPRCGRRGGGGGGGW